jgi:hypothetical protein
VLLKAKLAMGESARKLADEVAGITLLPRATAGRLESVRLADLRDSGVGIG